MPYNDRKKQRERMRAIYTRNMLETAEEKKGSILNEITLVIDYDIVPQDTRKVVHYKCRCLKCYAYFTAKRPDVTFCECVDAEERKQRFENHNFNIDINVVKKLNGFAIAKMKSTNFFGVDKNVYKESTALEDRKKSTG